MVVALIVIAICVVVAVGGYFFGSHYEVKLHKRTRVEMLDEDEETNTNVDEFHQHRDN